MKAQLGFNFLHGANEIASDTAAGLEAEVWAAHAGPLSAISRASARTTCPFETPFAERLIDQLLGVTAAIFIVLWIAKGESRTPGGFLSADLAGRVETSSPLVEPAPALV